MAVDNIPYPNRILRESTLKVGFDKIVAKFGDGYDQVAANGLNSIVDTWEVVWGSLSDTEYQEILTSLRATKGIAKYLWTPPGGTIQKKFRVTSEITQSREGNSNYRLSCTLTQVFTLG